MMMIALGNIQQTNSPPVWKFKKVACVHEVGLYIASIIAVAGVGEVAAWRQPVTVSCRVHNCVLETR